MEAQAKLCFIRLLDLNIQFVSLVDEVCKESMMDGRARERLTRLLNEYRERLEKTKQVIER